MAEFDTRYIAVDWSGSASIPAQKRSIVAADWQAGVVSVTSGRTRAETIEWLIAQATKSPRLVVGLDFAFSFPAWFVRQHLAEKPDAAISIAAFWQIVAAHGEDWLATCAPPFWGRRLATGGGRPCPPGHRAPRWSGYRVADRRRSSGIQPKSPFQIGGAGAVGTGSIRGIPALLALRGAGFSIWPFDPPVLPLAMEIYPRSFTGPVNKRSREARRAFFQSLRADLSPKATRAAVDTEDAFDAVCSVLGMARQAAAIRELRQAADAITQLEGSIFPGKPLVDGPPSR